MHLPEFALLAIATVAAIAAGLVMVASNYRAARVLAWIAAISFGSLGIVWAQQSHGYSLATQMIVAAVCAGIGAAALVWGLDEIKGRSTTGEPQATDKSASGKNSPNISTRNGNINIGQIGDVIHPPPVPTVDLTKNEGVLKPDNLPTPPLPAVCTKPIPEDALMMFFGKNTVAWSNKFPQKVLRMARENMLIFDKKGDSIVITLLRLYSGNSIVARIDEDGFWVAPNTYKKRPDEHTLIIHNERDIPILKIQFLNRKAITIEGVFTNPDAHPKAVVITKEAMIEMPEKNQLSFCMGNNGTMFYFGNIDDASKPAR
jgi:hypothetical protein